MPRQSDSAENKPGEKAMMRKLAVTVFAALSFAALGCGSDSGTKSPDAYVAPGTEAGQKDTGSKDQAQQGSEVQANGPEAGLGIEAGKVDGTVAPVDQAPPVDQVVAPVDGPKAPVDGTVKPVDGGVGVDATPAVVDGSSTPDAPASEAGGSVG
jgi:hypothetical protein